MTRDTASWAKEAGEAADIALGAAKIAKKAAASIPQPDPRDAPHYELLVPAYPHETLTSTPPTQTLVGGSKPATQRNLAGPEHALVAHGVFGLMRADAEWVASVATLEQSRGDREHDRLGDQGRRSALGGLARRHRVPEAREAAGQGRVQTHLGRRASGMEAVQEPV
jgi:hypothetical protein